MSPFESERIMYKQALSCLLLICGIVCFVLGCSGDETTGPEPNDSPLITFTYEKIAVASGATENLTVDVSDPDDDPLEVTWVVTRGTLLSSQGDPTMTWRAPTSTGLDTIWVTVSDGKKSRTILETIVVGFPWSQEVLSEDVTWRTVMSPYVLTIPANAMTVPRAKKLTIEPGVTVYISPGMSWAVTGILEINGTSGNIVRLEPNHRDVLGEYPLGGFWEGIVVSTDGPQPGVLDLSYAKISYGAHNITVTSSASATLNGCELIFSALESVFHGSTGSLTIQNCSVTDNLSDAIKISAFISNPLLVNILSNDIKYNSGAGMVFDFPDSKGQVPMNVTGNEIIWNASYGIHFLKPSYPEIHDNTIYANDYLQSNPINSRNIRLEPGFAGDPSKPEISAELNYWVTTDSTQIDNSILDSADRGDINTRVKFWPWRVTPP